MPILKSLFWLFCTALLTNGVQAQTAPDFELSDDESLRLRIYSQLSPLQINQIHSWELELVTAEGEPVDEADITVTGGMPDHDHGLPTNPQVTARLDNGRYLLEGVRFHMPGRWVLQFTIQTQRATTELNLEFNL